MKIKFFLHIFLFVFLPSLRGQNKTYDAITCVIYKMAKPDDQLQNNSRKNIDYDNMVKAFDAIECELYFTKSKSIFKMIDKLELNNDLSYQLASVFSSGVYYKDIIEHCKSIQTEDLGEKLNIVLPFEQYKWVITTETKMISGYKCYKAICEWEEFDVRRNKKLVFHPVAWFTPDIPAPFGPIGLDGLPGLVLEGNLSGSNYFYAVKISFDVDTKIKLSKPTNIKNITEKEYQDLMIKGF